MIGFDIFALPKYCYGDQIKKDDTKDM